jgi:hypothetical protein
MNKTHTARSLISALLVLLIVVTTYLAQGVRNDAPRNQNNLVVKEKGNEDRVRNNVSSVLARSGINPGSPLASADAQSHRQLRIRWRSFGKSDSRGLLKTDQLASAATLTRTASTVRTGAIPRERSFELSNDRILIIAVDETEAVRWWRLIVDPRLVRAEVGSTSDKQSQDFYLPDVELAVECPDDQDLKQLRFYRPHWNGQEFQLELIGVLALD